MSKRYLIKSFIKNNVVLLIATVCAIISCFFVTPDAQYIEYFDFSTLVCLLGMSVVISAIKNIKFFRILARKIIGLFKTTRSAITALVVITYVASMLIANDMALITFLHLGYFVLHSAQKEEYIAYTFTMQTISANLGGMLTPFGNPQNLYLYSKFNIPTMEFMGIMLVPFALSIALITVCCLVFVKGEALELKEERVVLPVKRTIIYLVLFALSIVIVFRGIPYFVGLIVIPIALLLLDRDALKKVDYPLLLTFVFFFIFAGNMGRIDGVRTVFSFLMEKSTLLFSTLSCQFISNVPSAILLSQFTTNYKDLLLGVNIGGVGSLIASLASLITLREYSKNDPQGTKAYIIKFSLFNFAFLFILTGAMFLIKLI